MSDICIYDAQLSLNKILRSQTGYLGLTANPKVNTLIVHVNTVEDKINMYSFIGDNHRGYLIEYIVNRLKDGEVRFS